MMGDNEAIVRVVYIFVLLIAWHIFALVYNFIPHSDLSKYFSKLPLNSYRIYSTFISFLSKNNLLYYLIYIFYYASYIIIFAASAIYVIFIRRDYVLADTMLATLSILLIIYGLIYSVVPTLPPWKYYGFDFPFKQLFAITNNYFVFPSLHIALPFLLFLFLKEYSNKIKYLLGLIIAVYPLIIYITAAHWLYDSIPSFIIPKIIKNFVSKSKSLVGRFENLIITKSTQILVFLLIFLLFLELLLY